MNDWKEVRLGEVIDIKHGFAFKGDFFSERPTNKLLLTPGNFMIGGGFQYGKLKYYDGPIDESYILKAGEVIVTMTDLSKEGDTLGYSATIPLDKNNVFLHNQRIGKVIASSNKINLNFIYWLMRTQDYRNEILATCTGSTVRHTSPNRIQNYSFLLPPLHEQRAIAEVLGALDDKIEHNRRTNQTLEAMARALFRDWFVDFGPTRAKAEGREAYLAPDLWALFPDGFNEEGIPEGWRVEPLDKIADFLNGLALQKYPGTGVDDLPVIKIAELRAGITAKSDRCSSALPPKYIVNDGDILFSWSGSLVQKIWTQGRGALNQHLFKVSSERYPKWFHYFWVDHYLPWFQTIAASKATTMGHIQRHHLTESLAVIADELLMAAADATIGPLLDKITANDLENRQLTQMRDYLLPKLISGEVRVRDAEKIVGESV